MSQVQPPRTRSSRHRPETIHLLRSAIINIGSVFVTAMLLRIAILLAVPNTQERGLHLIARATHLVVWPLQRISILQRFVHGGLTIADLATLAVIIICWFIAIGIVAGWEQEGRRLSGTLPGSRLRP